jgi:hypothetical protein
MQVEKISGRKGEMTVEIMKVKQEMGSRKMQEKYGKMAVERKQEQVGKYW